MIILILRIFDSYRYYSQKELFHYRNLCVATLYSLPDPNGLPGYTEGDWQCQQMKTLYRIYMSEVDYANVKIILFGQNFEYEGIVIFPLWSSNGERVAHLLEQTRVSVSNRQIIDVEEGRELI